MEKDSRQLRTSNERGLVGYKAKVHGQKAIAIMKGRECRECLGYILEDDVMKSLETGPYIELDQYSM